MGGLTAVEGPAASAAGSEDLIYFGDTARVPYGGRSQETLLKYARQDIAFLRSFDLKAVSDRLRHSDLHLSGYFAEGK
ncbi:MAG: hypothetical protein ACLSHO_00690 [Dysosmobacter sp.]